jgi:hypothetical protein
MYMCMYFFVFFQISINWNKWYSLKCFQNLFHGEWVPASSRNNNPLVRSY